MRTVEAACSRFDQTAFSDVDRAALLGINDAALPDVATARVRTTQLQRALAAFEADLQASGIDDSDLVARLEVAKAFTDSAVPRSIEAGALDRQRKSSGRSSPS